MIPFARILIVLGLILLVAGGLIYLFARVGIPLGRLPGDFRFQTGNLTCFFPLATMIILSVVLTVLLNIIAKILNR